MGSRLPQVATIPQSLDSSKPELQQQQRKLREEQVEEQKTSLVEEFKDFFVDDFNSELTKDVRFLKIAWRKPNHPKVVRLLEELKLKQDFVKAFNLADKLKDKARKAKIKNFVLTKMAEVRPFSPETGKLATRGIIKNFLSGSPDEQVGFLKKLGFDAKFDESGRLGFKKPNESQFRSIDPPKMEIEDFTIDIFRDFVQAIAEGIAASGAAIATGATGPGALVAASAAQAGVSGLFETGSQVIGKAIGAREEFEGGKIAEEAGISGLSGLGLGFLGGLTRGGVRTSAGVTRKAIGIKKSKGAGDVVESSKQLNKFLQDKLGKEAKEFKPTPGQLFDDQTIVELEKSLRDIPGSSSKKFRKQLNDNNEAIRQFTDIFFDKAAFGSTEEIGSRVKRIIIDSFKEKIKPAEKIYVAFRKEIGDKEIILTPRLEEVIKTAKDSTINPRAQDFLLDIESLVPRVKTLNDLEEITNIIGDEFKSLGVKGKVARTLFRDLKGIRSKELNKFINENADDLGEELFDLSSVKIDQADGIYAKAIDDLEKGILGRGKNKIRGKGLAAQAEEILDKIPDEKIVNKLLQSNDFAKVNELSKRFPEVFKELRLGKIKEILNKSTSRTTGEVSPKMFLRELDNISDSTKKLLFGEDVLLGIKSLKKLVHSEPALFNPKKSGISLEFLSLFKKIKAAPRQMKLDFLSSPKVDLSIFELPSAREAIITRGVPSRVLNQDTEMNNNLRKKFLRQQAK